MESRYHQYSLASSPWLPPSPPRPNIRSLRIGSSPFHSAEARSRTSAGRRRCRPCRPRSTGTPGSGRGRAGSSPRPCRARCSPRGRCPRPARPGTAPRPATAARPASASASRRRSASTPRRLRRSRQSSSPRPDSSCPRSVTRRSLSRDVLHPMPPVVLASSDRRSGSGRRSAATSTRAPAASGWSPTASAATRWARSAGLRTRRYHGLLVVAGDTPAARRRRRWPPRPGAHPAVRRAGCGSATHEWADGDGRTRAGTSCWSASTWSTGCPAGAGGSATWCSSASWRCAHGRPCAGRRAPAGRRRPGRADRWRRCAPGATRTASGTPAAPTCRSSRPPTARWSRARTGCAGPGWEPARATWWRGVHHREEAARGLQPRRGPVARRPVRAPSCAAPGDALEVSAWAGDLDDRAAAGRRGRRRGPAAQPGGRGRRRPADAVDATLALAADAFVVDDPRPGRTWSPATRGSAPGRGTR